MNDKDIMIGITKILVDEFEIDEEHITPEATLYDSLGLDSLDSVDLIVALEKAFSFRIDRTADEETIKSMRRVSDVSDFIKKKLS